jgi:hypothetical protein
MGEKVGSLALLLALLLARKRRLARAGGRRFLIQAVCKFTLLPEGVA